MYTKNTYSIFVNRYTCEKNNQYIMQPSSQKVAVEYFCSFRRWASGSFTDVYPLRKT